MQCKVTLDYDQACRIRASCPVLQMTRGKFHHTLLLRQIDEASKGVSTYTTENDGCHEQLTVEETPSIGSQESSRNLLLVQQCAELTLAYCPLKNC